MRTRHACAVVGAVGIVGPGKGRVDRNPWRAQVHGSGAVIGEAGQIIRAVHGRHGNHVVHVIAGRVVGRRVGIPRVVASGRHEQDLLRVGCRDSIPHRLTVAAAAPTIAEDLGAFGDCIVDAFDGVADVAAPAGAEKLAGHQTHLPRHADMRIAIVGRRANGAGAVGAVVVVVEWVARVGDSVNTEHIVHIPIPVVVQAIAWNFVRIAPHLRGEFEMVVVDARVNYCHDHVSVTGSDVPGVRGTDVRAR